jgi:hypothetical protein
MRHIAFFPEQRWNHKMINAHDALSMKYQAEVRTLRCTLPYVEMQVLTKRYKRSSSIVI